MLSHIRPDQIKDILYLLRIITFIGIVCTLPNSCTDSSIRLSKKWEHTFPSLGTFSSIKCADLNDDDIKDIVLGAGQNEFDSSDSAVIALDGVDGSLLWTHPGIDQMVGSAVFADMNLDGHNDVIISGRKTQLKVIDGTDGSELWSYKIKHHDYNAKGYIRFNFFNPQLIDDLTADGIPELLIANGGNILAYKQDGSDRYPGVLGILDGSSGNIIAADTMPDGQETYMSPVIYEEEGEQIIIYGSGGERHGGHLYKTTLSALKANDISESQVLAKREGHGFIAPPTLADITGDHKLDIVANWHGGEMMAIDGKTNAILWFYRLSNTELNCSPTPGDATGDDVPDFFSSFTIGAWPNNKGSVQVLVDGANGQALWQDSSGCVGFSTALSYDLDHDGRTEFIYTVNDHNCTGIYLGMTKFSLHYYDHKTGGSSVLYPPRSAKNISSTPWLGRLDDDEHLDLVLCLQANYNDIYSYHGLQINRLEVNTSSSSTPSWTEYMGSDSRCIYH